MGVTTDAMISRLGCHVCQVCFLVLLSVISSAKAADNTTSDDGVIQEESSSSVDPALIVVCVTFPVGIVVGAAWCYCLTAVCKIRDHGKVNKPSVQGMAAHNRQHRHHDPYHDDDWIAELGQHRSPSPLSLGSSGSTTPVGSRSPSPLALPPDIP